jgi:PAS domain S-box-containing protein
MITAAVHFLHRSLVRKLVAVVVSVHVLLTVVLVGEMVRRYTNLLHQRLVSRSFSTVTLLREGVLPLVTGHDLIALDNLLQRMRLLPDIESIEVTDERGKVLGHTDHYKVGKFAIDGRSRSLWAAPVRDDGDLPVLLQDSTRLIETGIPISMHGHRLGSVRVTLWTHSSRRDAHVATTSAVAIGLGAIAIGIFLTVAVARRLSRRLKRLMGAVDFFQSVGTVDSSTDREPDEVGSLARVLSQFMSEIIANRRRILADRQQLEGLVRQRTEELQQTTQQALESKLFIEKIIAATPSGILVADALGHGILTNQATLTILDCDKAALAEKSLDEIALFGHAAIKAAVDEARGHTRTTTCHVDEPGGRSLHCTFTPFEAHGRGFLLCKLTDVSKEKAYERDLEQARRELETVIDHIPGLVFYRDTQGRLLRVNRTVELAYGLSRNELVGRSLETLHEPEMAKRYSEDDRRVIESGEALLNIEEAWETAQGRRWLLTSRVAVKDVRGVVQGVLGISIDVTERKATESKLAEISSRFRAIFNNSPDPYLLVGMEVGEILDCNLATEQLLGLDKLTIWGRTIDSLSPQYQPDGRLSTVAMGEHMVISRFQGFDRFEWLLSSGGDHGVWVDVNASVVELDARPVLLIVWRDITAHKALEESLQRSNQELEQFAYVASHDLQEPLRMVASYTELLAERYQGKLDERADKFIGYAVDGAKRMQDLIRDLLMFSRVGSGADAREPVPADQALQEALTNLQFAIRESRGTVTHGVLPTVKAAKTQLVLLFQNLVGNALKFRGDKAPEIHVSAEERAGEWIFCVKDNGIGLDPRYAEKIFKVFQRLHERGKYPGSGIGLAICKKIATQHGGRIWVESQPGQGASFLFSWPKQNVAAQ